VPATRLEDDYDTETVARLDAWARREAERIADAPLPVRRRAAGIVLVTALGLGLQAVLEPDRSDPIVEEVDVGGLDTGERIRLLWTGFPRTTVALVR
jgi:hypothetical protein